MVSNRGAGWALGREAAHRDLEAVDAKAQVLVARTGEKLDPIAEVCRRDRLRTTSAHGSSSRSVGGHESASDLLRWCAVRAGCNSRQSHHVKATSRPSRLSFSRTG